MYSPKIKEDLVPIIYQKAKSQGIPMTSLVDKIIRDSLSDDKSKPKEVNYQDTPKKTPLIALLAFLYA